MALIDHAPNEGLWFDPISDLVISIVLRAGHCRVVRDLGTGRVEFVDRPGCTLVAPPGCATYWRFESRPLVLHLGVPDARLPDLLGSADLDRDVIEALRYPSNDPLVTQLAMRMWQALDHEGDASPTGFAERGLATILTLLLSGPAVAARRLSRRIAPLSPARLRKARGLMIQRTGGAGIETLAQAVDLSPGHFSRSFRAATGETPHRMASTLRIEEAKRLLAETDLPVTSIALDLGFASSAHFSSRFKALVGMPPSRWRAALRG